MIIPLGPKNFLEDFQTQLLLTSVHKQSQTGLHLQYFPAATTLSSGRDGYLCDESNCLLLNFSIGTYGFIAAFFAGGDVIMAGPSHSPRSTEMLPWIKRDFPHWTLLNDPCLEQGQVTPLCKGKEVDVGLQGFDANEIFLEALAKKIPVPAKDRITSGYFNFTEKLVLP